MCGVGYRKDIMQPYRIARSDGKANQTQPFLSLKIITSSHRPQSATVRGAAIHHTMGSANPSRFKTGNSFRIFKPHTAKAPPPPDGASHMGLRQGPGKGLESGLQSGLPPSEGSASEPVNAPPYAGHAHSSPHRSGGTAKKPKTGPRRFKADAGSSPRFRH